MRWLRSAFPYSAWIINHIKINQQLPTCIYRVLNCTCAWTGGLRSPVMSEIEFKTCFYVMFNVIGTPIMLDDVNFSIRYNIRAINKPISQTPQYLWQVSPNAPFYDINVHIYVHISVTKWCILGYETVALWNLCNRSITYVIVKNIWFLLRNTASSGCAL